MEKLVSMVRRDKTPELDLLAKEEYDLPHITVAVLYVPARCSLMTGLHSGHGYIRSNSPGYPNGQMPIPENTETVAKLMKRAAYNTAIIGKWGLGGVVDDTPNPTLNSDIQINKVLTTFLGYLDQRKAHNYYQLIFGETMNMFLWLIKRMVGINLIKITVMI